MRNKKKNWELLETISINNNSYVDIVIYNNKAVNALVYTLLKSGKKSCLAFKFDDFIKARLFALSLIKGKKLIDFYMCFCPSPSQIKKEKEVFESLLI